MKIPKIAANDSGNGNIIETAIPIPKDKPIHISELRRNFLLLNPVFASPPSYLSV